MSNYSPDPGVPQTPTKALAGGVLSGIIFFVGQWIIDTDPFTAKEIANAAIGAVVASGLTGVTTYAVKNRRTR